MSPHFSTETSEINVQALMRGLVHELRNPLSAVLMASSLVQGNPDVDEETAMLLEVIQKESRRMNRILTEFSHFVKPPAPQLVSFNFSELARHAIHSLKNDGAFCGVEIADELDENLSVIGDPAQTEQALHHVLQNAAQALEGGGRLVLAEEKIAQFGCIVVGDSGGELEKGVVEQAFQPFFSTKPAATGLGLSIARVALRAAQGDVVIEAAAQGARVRLCLPLDGAA